MSTVSVYSASYISGAMNSGVPSTVYAFSLSGSNWVDSPRSPILMLPSAPSMKMLSHLRSRWITGGSCVWRYIKHCRIDRQYFLTCAMLIGYLHVNSFSVPAWNSSVTNTTCMDS